MKQPLIQLIYASAATVAFSSEALNRLLMRARMSNDARGITGMLLYDNGTFFQVLEGPEDAVFAAFAKINSDPRHSHVRVICCQEVEQRSFKDWSMGYATATHADMERLPGLRDLFNPFLDFAKMGKDRAHLMLASFRNGVFRMLESEPLAA